MAVIETGPIFTVSLVSRSFSVLLCATAYCGNYLCDVVDSKFCGFKTPSVFHADFSPWTVLVTLALAGSVHDVGLALINLQQGSDRRRTLSRLLQCLTLDSKESKLECLRTGTGLSCIVISSSQ